MKTYAVLLAVLALVGLANATNFGSLGYSDDTVIEGDQSDQCVGSLIYDHDYSFENGYCWQLQGIAPPYYGAWGEAFDVGPCTVECGVYWLTQIGYMPSHPLDAYVWEGGVDGPPGNVRLLVPGVTGLNIGFWPTCTMNEVYLNCCMTTDFTVGYWVDFSSMVCEWYTCADENGYGGHPWTNIAPGIGYPTGWQHPNVAFPDAVALGIGATITEIHPSPVESQSWGAIKSLYK